MLMQTVIALLDGNKDLSNYYLRAKEIWKEIIESPQFENEDSLSKELTGRESEFQMECGGRELGGEIMAFVAVGQFYNNLIGVDGSLSELDKISRAFEKSMCRFETKAAMVSALEFFK